MPTQNNKLVDINGAKILYDDLRDRVEGKLDAPDTAGTSGQVLTSDGQGGQAWANPPACDISDVQVNGTSIVSNGVANIPIATDSSLGVIYPNGTSLKIVAGGILGLSGANSNKIKTGTDSGYPIMPNKEHEAAFYGLAKAAGDSTQSASDNAVGTYTDGAKTAINTMIGSISKDNLDGAGITAKTYTTVYSEQTLTTATGADYMSPYALFSSNQSLYKGNMYKVVFDGTEYILPVHSWSMKTNDKKDGRSFEYIGNLALYQSDVSGVPEETDDVPFFIANIYSGTSTSNHESPLLTGVAGSHTVLVQKINNAQVKIPDALIYGNSYVPLKTCGGATSSYNGFSIGINELKSKRGTIALGFHNTLEQDFGIAIGKKNDLSTAGYAFGENNEISGADAIAIGYNLQSNGSGMIAMGIKNVPANKTFPNFQANTTYKKGDIVVGKWMSIMPDMTWICVGDHTSANSTYMNQDLDGGGTAYWILTPSDGDTAFVIGNGNNVTASNALKVDLVGNTYLGGNLYVNCDADSTGGTMLPTDVQVNGTSVVTNGVANIPIASDSNLGVVKVNQYTNGLSIVNGFLGVSPATTDIIKTGTDTARAITPVRQHVSMYYGLSKLAGVDLASETVTVGTYPEASKIAIQTMLGVEKGVTLVETISETTPTITAQPNVRYNCGTVSTISITPPASGTCDIVFTSGSTATVLTVPNTVKWPVWFNASSLVANTIYEIMITDGTYGSVMTWAS